MWTKHSVGHCFSGGENDLCVCVYASHPNILRPEQELSVQIGFFNEVHVRHSDEPASTSAESNQCKVFKELAANCPSSNLGGIKRASKFKNIIYLKYNFETISNEIYVLYCAPPPSPHTRNGKNNAFKVKTGRGLALSISLLWHCGSQIAVVAPEGAPCWSTTKPGLTRKYFCPASFSWNAEPNTAVCPSYLVPLCQEGSKTSG